MAELLLELYSEEIPPQLQIAARSQIKQSIENSFEEDSINYKELLVYSSPTRLMARTVISMAMPGNVHIHQATRNIDLPSLMIKPQLITLGSPQPKKASPLSIKIAVATISEPITIIGLRQFGRISASIMRISLIPRV